MPSTLLLVNLQNDFMPKGAVPVPQGNEAVHIANDLSPHYEVVVASQDWHPRNHRFFADQHEGKQPFDRIEIDGVEHTLLPVHCVQDSYGAEFHRDLESNRITKVSRTGIHSKHDTHSAFADGGGQDTDLAGWLRSQRVTALDIMGVSTEGTVKQTVLDALEEGFKVRVLVPGCRGWRDEDSRAALREMEHAGAVLQKDISFQVHQDW